MVNSAGTRELSQIHLKLVAHVSLCVGEYFEERAFRDWRALSDNPGMHDPKGHAIAQRPCMGHASCRKAPYGRHYVDHNALSPHMNGFC